MKYCITIFFGVMTMIPAMAQNQNPLLTSVNFNGLSSGNSESLLRKSLWPQFFSPDRQQLFRPRSPMAITLTSSTTFKGENYWMDAMTTQSYNQGKLGTYYLWDVQGNLRESRMFLDIAGKNKRGLKLIFRRR